ncbi:hypothetical protein ATZ36_04710 [Candidatus Endomicrobiellum trichonymphae]|uniref:Uncharacterized protein n=1 Tax=Endomicrobium trichonymphae TaxID=1408204 RepID=A0A1E5IIX3_ENDTX|nr:hypothetical protein ATZ36_04710 [Candidatus Endomicrobium trichonymphae]
MLLLRIHSNADNASVSFRKELIKNCNLHTVLDLLSEDDLADFVKLQKPKADSDNPWIIKAADVNEETWDLSVKTPIKKMKR